MARVELGERKVQGVDYAYTLQGWLKDINSQSLDPEKDRAEDGLSSSPLFKNMSRDVYGFSIGYHPGDYQPIGTSTAPAFDQWLVPVSYFDRKCCIFFCHLGAVV